MANIPDGIDPAVTAECERRATYLTAEDIAFIRANTKRLAAKPMPEHIRLAIARTWNPSRNAEVQKRHRLASEAAQTHG